MMLGADEFAKLLDFSGLIGEVRGWTGLEPAPLFAALVILTQLGLSALLIAGGRLTWIGAVALAGFIAIATLFAHAFWPKPAAEQFINRNTAGWPVANSLSMSRSQAGLYLWSASRSLNERRPG